MADIDFEVFYTCTLLNNVTYKDITYIKISALINALLDNSVTVDTDAFGNTVLAD